MKISHSLSKGLYCTVNDGDRNITHEESEEILKVMRDYVEKEVPIRYQMFTRTRPKILEQQGLSPRRRSFSTSRARALGCTSWTASTIISRWLHGSKTPGYLKKFDLIKYGEGVILMHPHAFFSRQDSVF